MVRKLTHYSSSNNESGVLLHFTDGAEEFQMQLSKIGAFKMITDLILCAGDSGLMDTKKTLVEICQEIERKYSNGN